MLIKNGRRPVIKGLEWGSVDLDLVPGSAIDFERGLGQVT